MNEVYEYEFPLKWLEALQADISNQLSGVLESICATLCEYVMECRYDELTFCVLLFK